VLHDTTIQKTNSILDQSQLAAIKQNMVGLHSLSNELLIQIFHSCPTIQSAMSLSKVDKTLHAIWLTYNSRVTKDVLRQQIPAYEDAVDLAILEQFWITSNTQPVSAPFSKTTTQLLHNAELATNATDAWARAAKMDGMETSDIQKTLSAGHKSPYAAYYLMRKIVLSYHYPEARFANALRATIRSYSREDKDRLDTFCRVLTRNEPELRDRGKHGIDKPRSEWKEYEWGEENEWGRVVSDPWKYVDRIIAALVRDDDSDTPGEDDWEMVLGATTDTAGV
jgi:hypothetical protein